ncbi:sentrin-specific protease 2-like [Stylonychia lemnae]|uniref:Sentrin-specific protease 2-like n=1 Tax=Stylonychia lemnae TaxID=5949 RepID=A0A078AJY2_STYLE|nr:sentrin-specific protease 2-like [Stylonychia lemnae]|eukprot:CDW82695.1 sentrin-specific protease 2-like [Stylonychia lemnae]
MNAFKSFSQAIFAMIPNIFSNPLRNQNAEDNCSYSSAEEIECSSECSLCYSDNLTVSKSSRDINSKHSSKSQKSCRCSNGTKKLRLNQDIEHDIEKGGSTEYITLRQQSSNRIEKLLNNDSQKNKENNIPQDHHLRFQQNPFQNSQYTFGQDIFKNRNQINKRNSFVTEKVQIIQSQESQGYQQLSQKDFQNSQDKQQAVRKSLEVNKEKSELHQENDRQSILPKRQSEEKKITFELFNQQKSSIKLFTLEDLKQNSICLDQTMKQLEKFANISILDQDPIPAQSQQQQFQQQPSQKRKAQVIYNEEIENDYNEIVVDEIFSKDKLMTEVVINNHECNYQIYRGSMECLKPGKWFNDEILNAYTELVNYRDNEKNLNNVYVFSTFFYTMIDEMVKRNDYNYNKLMRKISKKGIKLEKFKLLLVPINLTKYHWFLIALDLKANINYVIDSMRTSNLERYQNICRNLQRVFNEYIKSTGENENPKEFQIEICEGIPSQDNGHDCGMCTCLNMELLGINADVNDLSYQNSEEFSANQRRKIAVELVKGELTEQKY